MRDYCRIARQYAEQVVSGKIPACQWVKLACQRQLDDLAREKWKYRFDEERGNHICRFLELLPHIKGRWKTKNIVLEPWQCFQYSTIFGWVDREGDHWRRFRKALIVVPRKNAKSTGAAGVGLYLLGADGEPGAEIYSAATTRDQAKISWDVAKKMAERTPGMRERYGIQPMSHSIVIEQNASSFKPLSRDADTLEGLNVHGGIIDELHAHKTREVFDVLDEATGSRQQPLLFIISTEGDNAAGVFAEQVTYCQHILQKTHEDETFFGIVYTIDPGDEWTDPLSWRKANPNYGVSVFEKDMESRCKQAQKNPASQSSFLCKRLNVRVGAGDAWFNLLAWRDLCQDKALRIEDFYGQPCFVGIDLAKRIDLAGKVIVFPCDDKFFVFAKAYLPEDAADKGNPNYDVYRGWSEARKDQNSGLPWLTLTPGPTIDYEYIERDLMADRDRFQIQRVAIDPHNAWHFNQRMSKELGEHMMSEVPQHITRFSDPMKESATRILNGKIQHDGNPILTWCLGNVVGKEDSRGYVYPHKERQENLIDLAIAWLMAFGEAVKFEPVASAWQQDRIVI